MQFAASIVALFIKDELKEFSFFMYTLLRNLITPLSQNSPMRKIDKKKLRNSSNFCHPLPSPNFLNTGNSTLKISSMKYFQFNIETCFNAYQGVIFSGLLVRQTSL